MESKAFAIGHDALKTMRAADRVTTVFTTSSGIFLTTELQSMLFLTTGRYRGPFTINIEGSLPPLPPESANSIRLLYNGIRFEDPDWLVRLTAETQVWQPSRIDPENQASGEIISRSIYLLTILKELRAAQAANRDHSDFDARNQEKYERSKAAVKSVLLSESDAGLSSVLKSMIGCGGGLTPAGDDFLCGFLLADHFFQRSSERNFDLSVLSKDIIDQAKNTTTSLSWNLLRCAAQGSADERILNCAAWLADGEGNLDEIIKELLTYGSSSGLETLEGLITYINP